MKYSGRRSPIKRVQSNTFQCIYTSMYSIIDCVPRRVVCVGWKTCLRGQYEYSFRVCVAPCWGIMNWKPPVQSCWWWNPISTCSSLPRLWFTVKPRAYRFWLKIVIWWMRNGVKENWRSQRMFIKITFCLCCLSQCKPQTQRTREREMPKSAPFIWTAVQSLNLAFNHIHTHYRNPMAAEKLTK